MNPKRTRCLARIVWARLRLLLLMLMVTHEAYETSNFMPPHPLSYPCLSSNPLPFAWMRKMRHSRDLHFVILIFLSGHHSSQPQPHSLSHLLTLPPSLSLSLSSCTLTGGISISRGTTMKTNAFRTKRAQIWNNFLLVNQTKGHVPPSSTRCTPLYTLPPLPL